MREALKDSLSALIREMQMLIERTPPVVLRSIQKNGIYLTGGLANQKGIADYIEGTLGLKIHTVSQPEFCSVEGLKKIIQSKELQKLTFSMLDESYRWIR